MSPNSVNFLAAIGSILSAIVAIVALAYSYHQFKSSLAYANAQDESENSIKKYEVKRDYQSAVISWFSRTTEILIRLRFLLINDHSEFKANKISLLADLSTQIEIGRLYFPNIDKGDGYGLEKPKAYQGHRNLTLVFLVYSYDIFLLNDAINYQKHLLRLQREFTSIISEIIDPDSFLRETEKHSDKFFSQRVSVQEFIERKPESIDLFFVKRTR